MKTFDNHDNSITIFALPTRITIISKEEGAELVIQSDSIMLKEIRMVKVEVTQKVIGGEVTEEISDPTKETKVEVEDKEGGVRIEYSRYKSQAHQHGAS